MDFLESDKKYKNIIYQVLVKKLIHIKNLLILILHPMKERINAYNIFTSKFRKVHFSSSFNKFYNWLPEKEPSLGELLQEEVLHRQVQ